MKWIIVFLVAFVSPALGGLERYEALIPPAASSSSPLPAKGVRVTYLGTNGYLLEAKDATILVDPYFSRMSLFRSALGLRTVGRPEFVEQWVKGVRRIDAILVTHGHVDHLYDVPQIARLTGAKVIASPTSIWLVKAAGVSPRQGIPVLGGSPAVRIRGARVYPLPATHDRILGKIPFEGTLDGPPKRPPATVADWKCGEPLAFLVEIGGQRIFMKSGALRHDAAPANLGRIDLAIHGVATPDARVAYGRSIENLRPRFILPSHQDNFFRPVDKPFVFLIGSDFPEVLRRSGSWRDRVRLLRPFQPWMLR